jgi:hypothetical protein
VNRRQFSITAAALAVAPLGTWIGGASIASDLTFETQLQRLFSTPRHAIDLGRRYLQLHPEKASRVALMGDLVGHNDDSSMGNHPLANLVAYWQERDFHEGVVVVLDGWVLARAEVSLCALLFLTNGPSPDVHRFSKT